MMNTSNKIALTIVLTLFALVQAAAFGYSQMRRTRPRTFLNLEEHVAKMVDEEYYRLTHKDEYDEQWQKKRDVVKEVSLPENFVFSGGFMDAEDRRQFIRDKKLATNNPERYCADRCVATGSCEIFEDFFSLTPEEVLSFCTDCVLSEEEEPCDVPEAFFPEDSEEEIEEEEIVLKP